MYSSPCRRSIQISEWGGAENVKHLLRTVRQRQDDGDHDEANDGEGEGEGEGGEDGRLFSRRPR